MASIEFTGLEAYIRKLDLLTNRTTEICRKSVWEGGKVVGDAIKASLSQIRTQDEWVPKDEKREGVRSDEKEDIINAFGLSKMRDEHGTISTKAGFKSGTKIRAVESGTSYMRKHPVVRQAVNTAKPIAEKAMEQKFREETQDIMK